MWGHLPAYNRSLNVGIFFRGAFYSLSPWVAARASGLPAAYQDVHSGNRRMPAGAEVRSNQTTAAAGLANMVSPLQAREFGHAIAAEWQAPRDLPQLDALLHAPTLPESYGGHVPGSFPRTGSLTQHATLVFNCSSTGLWKYVSDHSWNVAAPAASLEQLCEEAVELGEISLLRSLTDLQRVVDDEALPDHARSCASVQLSRLQYENEQLSVIRAKRRLEEDRRRCRRQGFAWQLQISLADLLKANADLRRHLGEAFPDAWVACETCSKWRRLRFHGNKNLPEGTWTCLQDGALDRGCAEPQEFSDDEIDRLLDIPSSQTATSSEAYVASADTITILLRGASRPVEREPSSWVQCDRCCKWRRLRLSLQFSGLGSEWFCEFNTDARHNRCHFEEERWDGEETLPTDTSSLAVHVQEHYDDPLSVLALTHRPETRTEEHEVPIDLSQFGEVAINIADCLESCLMVNGVRVPSPKAVPQKKPQQALRPASTSQADVRSTDTFMAHAVPLPNRSNSPPSTPSSLQPAHSIDSQVHVAEELDSVLVTHVVKHHVYSGAVSGSLHNVYVSLVFSNGLTTGRHYVPSAPLLGSKVLRVYLDTEEGARIHRYIPSRWSGLHQ